jgi:hypothetical protein
MPYVSVAAQVGFGMRRIRAHPVQFRSAVESDGRGAAHRAHPPLFARRRPLRHFSAHSQFDGWSRVCRSPSGSWSRSGGVSISASAAPTQTRQPRACIRARVTAATSGGAPGDIREQAGVVGPQAQERVAPVQRRVERRVVVGQGRCRGLETHRREGRAIGADQQHAGALRQVPSCSAGQARAQVAIALGAGRHAGRQWIQRPTPGR